MALPSGKRTTVNEIVTAKGSIKEAFPPQSVTLTLTDEIDISRGDMLVHPDNIPHTSQTIEALLVWMAETPMAQNNTFLLKHTTRSTNASITQIRYQIDVNSLRKKPAAALTLNEIGRVTINTSQPLFFDPYLKNRTTGSFILIDSISNFTVAVGMIIDRRAADDQPETELGAQSCELTAIKEKQVTPLNRIMAEQLLKHEGLQLKPYHCPAGKLTIGIGRNLEERGISEKEAHFLLDNDIAEAITDLQTIFNMAPAFNEFTENVQRVLIDMHFNLGASGFRSFKKMIKAVKDKNFTLAAKEMQDSKWFHQVGVRGETLVKMMETEQNRKQ